MSQPEETDVTDDNLDRIERHAASVVDVYGDGDDLLELVAEVVCLQAERAVMLDVIEAAHLAVGRDVVDGLAYCRLCDYSIDLCKCDLGELSDALARFDDLLGTDG